MAASIVGALQPEMQNLITESKILLVGSGGIGCEVLKVLVMMGFCDLEVIDLDTIEVSNLNRQFLFDKHSVGKAKSHVARESVLKFNPNVNIRSHLGDIMDSKYDASFFAKFKLVINALDNKKARAHVNRMCLSVEVPLIESGTMGYSGQVEFIKKGVGMCYECLAKPEPKSYPMCTIRNTPKEPIHCIIWAKYLFNQLFGEPDLLVDDVSMEVEQNDNLTKLSAREWAINNDYEPSKLFKKIFIEDIHYLINMKDLYKEKDVKPTPASESLINDEYAAYSDEPDIKVLELAQYVSMFLDCIKKIKSKVDKTSTKELAWDKDDDDLMNFVVSSTNIRSTLFNIPMKSYFDIKTMAGNIIPAIATANALIAGQIVIHALRTLRGDYHRCQSVFLRAKPNHKGAILVKDKNLEKPNPNCFVCSVTGEHILRLDTKKITVRQLEDLVLKKKLNLVLPDVLADKRVLISSNEDDELNLYSFLLSDMNVVHGSRLKVDDYFQNYSVNLMVHHKVKEFEEDPDFEIFYGTDDMIKRDNEKLQQRINQGITTQESDDDCIIEEFEQDENNVKEVEGNTTNLEVAENETTGPTIDTEMQVIDSEHEIEDETESPVASDNQEFSNEEVLAIKRKADTDKETSEPKKSRIDE